jgi:uncharacterized repeat protein (TIGR03803 family)
MTPSGTLTTLYSFCSQGVYPDCTDGAYPDAGLVQATSGDFFGTTQEGGAYGYGTVFRITPSGTLTTLHAFGAQSGDGQYATAGLVQATSGEFFGTTQDGGAYGYGTAFRITASGTLTTLYSFCSQGIGIYPDCTDGAYLFAGLVQATNGDLYGATGYGGVDGDGTIFRLYVGLGPFVKTLPTSGKAGSLVKILDTDLAGATSVTFNGTAAKFTVVSASEIATTVPNGASTGMIEVVTPGGTLSSSVPFRVLP